MMVSPQSDHDGVAGDCVKPADLVAGPALDAFRRIEVMRL